MKKLIPVILSLVIILSCLSGCHDGKNDTSILAQDISLDDMHLYSATQLFDSFQYIFLTEPHDEGFYAYASMKEDPEKVSLYYCNLSDETINKVSYETNNETPLKSISSASNGALWVMEYVKTEQDGVRQDGYRINIFSDNKVTPFKHDEISGSSPIKLIVDDENGKVYIHSSNEREHSDYIYVYSLEGEQLAEIKCENTIQNMVFSKNEEKLFIIENKDNNAIISVLDENDYTINKVIQIGSTTNSMLYESSTYSVNVDVNSVMMGFDLNSKAFTPIIDWTANGLAGYVRFVFPYNDDYILIRREASNIDTVVKVSESTEFQGSKEKLKLATFGSDPLIDLAVAKFNKESNDYYIEIVDYSIYGKDALTKLNTEMISGEIPDIFDLDGLPVKQYISMGLLEDLDPYMKKDLNLDNLWESAISALYEDDKCYSVVPGFTINAIFGNTEAIEEIKNDNYRELLSYFGENSDDKQNVFGNYMTQSEFVAYMISCNMDQFIDYERKECHFDTDDFTALLATASGLAPYDEHYSETLKIYSGSQPISFQWIRGIFDIDLLSAVFKGNYATTTLASGTENSTGALMLPMYSFGMSASSEHKDGIWEFLKWLYSDDFQKLISGGIPMSKTAFEAQWDILKNVFQDEAENGNAGTTYLTIVDGVEEKTFIEYSKDRLACYQKTIDLINSIDRQYQVDTTVMDIISEDLSAFFYGDKSAKDTAAIIQSRVQIYLNE